MAGKAKEPVTLSTLAPAHGSTSARKRKGRGPGSGLGRRSFLPRIRQLQRGRLRQDASGNPG